MDIKKLKKSQKGGLKKSDYSLADLIKIFKRIPEADILKNLPNYIDRQIDKLEEKKIALMDKIEDTIKIDHDNREKIATNINSLIPGDEENDKVKKAYLEMLQSDVRGFMDTMRNSNFSVQQMEEYISKFMAAKDKINPQYVKSYKEECIKTFEDDFENSDTLIAYKEELLEYLIMVLGKEYIPKQNPFCVVLTGSPGLGKSSLANQIVKLLKVTNLLPIGKFINIKKPDVIGQYIGHTAPKTYKILTSAIGSIAFIDEAYSFAGEKRGSGGFDQFGKEFIDALVDFIEEYKGLISIVAAGYKKQMHAQFFEVNTGLYRRFPIQLNIKELKAITILKYLFDKEPIKPFLSIEPMRHFIQNFIRLAFNIEQTYDEEVNVVNVIVFYYNYILSDGTKHQKLVVPKENQSFMSHFFVKNGLFSNNWTDVQIFLDFLMNNIKLTRDPEVILKNTIKGYLTTKLENSNIEIKVTLHGANMYIQLMTDDNEANGTIKTFTSKNLKNDENEKTTEKELYEYFFKREFVPPRSSSSSSVRSAPAASAAASGATPSAPLSAITKVINTVHSQVIADNYYLDNFIRTMFNIEQLEQNKIKFYFKASPKFKEKEILPNQVYSFMMKYLPNIVDHIDILLETIEDERIRLYYEAEELTNLIPSSIRVFLQTENPELGKVEFEIQAGTLIIKFNLVDRDRLPFADFIKVEGVSIREIDRLKYAARQKELKTGE